MRVHATVALHFFESINCGFCRGLRAQAGMQQRGQQRCHSGCRHCGGRKWPELKWQRWVAGALPAGCRRAAERQVGASAPSDSCSCYNCLANNNYLQMSADEGLANGEAGGLCWLRWDYLPGVTSREGLPKITETFPVLLRHRRQSSGIPSQAIGVLAALHCRVLLPPSLSMFLFPLTLVSQQQALRWQQEDESRASCSPRMLWGCAVVSGHFC